MSSPKQFCEAMRHLVLQSQQHPATAVSDQAFHMKLRVLAFFIARDPDAETFERMLQERATDPDPQKELSKGICCQILNGWRSGSCHYTPEGHLVLRALYPAEPPPGWSESDPEMES